MKIIDITGSAILTILSGFLTYTNIAANSTFGIVVGACSTTLWAINLALHCRKRR